MSFIGINNDLQKDPYELHNLADDKKYAAVKEELNSKLTEWRKSANDPGVSEAFKKGGWPSVYPTRSLDEWKDIVEKWEKWLFSKPYSNAERPVIGLIPNAEPVKLK